MAVSPVSTMRVTQNLQTELTINSMRRNQTDLLQAQSRVSSGRSFARPSDDPVAASRATGLSQQLARQAQFTANLVHADSLLTAADNTIGEVSDLLINARRIASQNVSNLTSAEERLAEADLISGILQQMVTVGNRQFNDRYLFSGRDTLEMPFVSALGGVAYVGDTGTLQVRSASGQSATVSVPGHVLFGALSGGIASSVDLTPSLSAETRLDELGGATGAGFAVGIAPADDGQPRRGTALGTLVFNEQGGAGRFQVDLAGADTLGDVVARITDAAAAAGSTLTATVDVDGLRIVPGAAPVSITDTGSGRFAAELGILTPQPTNAPVTGEALRPRVTRTTPVATLAHGAGIDLSGGLRITNGDQPFAIDFSGAETVQDVLNRINTSGAFVFARINDAGTAIDVLNRVSGSALRISENGGTTAAALGLRTLNTATPLAELNEGRGVDNREGVTDFAVTASGGGVFEVNLDGAVTIGDVIDRINQEARTAGVAVTGELSANGAGIVLVDATGGAGALTVRNVNLSSAADDLGLTGVTADANGVLAGNDTNPVRTAGILDALSQLELALRSDDTRAISLAAARLDTLKEQVTRTHGQVGAQSQSMHARLEQMQDASVTTTLLLSQVRDLDYAEGITRLQGAQLRLQADLQTSGRLLGLSLLDFLA
jgi:flagellin-like hook-associated protein FlgL